MGELRERAGVTPPRLLRVAKRVATLDGVPPLTLELPTMITGEELTAIYGFPITLLHSVDALQSVVLFKGRPVLAFQAEANTVTITPVPSVHVTTLVQCAEGYQDKLTSVLLKAGFTVASTNVPDAVYAMEQRVAARYCATPGEAQHTTEEAIRGLPFVRQAIRMRLHYDGTQYEATDDGLLQVNTPGP